VAAIDGVASEMVRRGVEVILRVPFLNRLEL
jgi:hypothetical protein